MRKINAELNHLAEKFSNYWDYFDLIKSQAETSMGGPMSNLEFVGSKISNNVIDDLNNYVKVMDGNGNNIINYGQTKTFKISNGMQDIDVKITSEYGMPMDKQPTKWEEISDHLLKYNRYSKSNIDVNKISFIELDVPVKNNIHYRAWCSGEFKTYDINIKIHFNDGMTLTDIYEYGLNRFI
jgi:hypothetical protein